MIRYIGVSPFLTAIAFGASAQEEAPKVYIDKGACPFECCQYGPWSATQATPAFVSPGAKNAAIVIPAGTSIAALSGYVLTIGQPFIVTRAHDTYKPGDKLMVYTYYGEGNFSVWHKGRMFTEQLGFSPYGGTGGKRCTDKGYCWGTLSHELKSDWWVNVRLANMKTYWILNASGFEGQDSCD